MRRFQYLQKAEPFQQPGGLGWFTPPPQPRSRASRTAFIAPFLALAAVELDTVNVDKWFVHPPQPPLRPVSVNRALASVLAQLPPPASTIPPPYVQVIFPDQLKGPKQVQHDFFAIGAVELTDVTVDKWFTPPPSRQLLRKRFDPGITSTLVEFSTPAGAQVPSIAAWFTPPPRPVLRPRRQSHRSSFGWLSEQSPPEEITCDKWLPTFPSQFKAPRGLAVHVATSWANFTPPTPVETILADKWQPHFPSWFARLRGLRYNALAWNSLTPPNPIEVITADKWYTPTQIPGRRRQGLPPGYVSGALVEFSIPIQVSGTVAWKTQRNFRRHT